MLLRNQCALLGALVFSVSIGNAEEIIAGTDTYGWTYYMGGSQSKLDPIIANVGDTLVFEYNFQHDVYKMESLSCDFEGSQKLAGNDESPFKLELTEDLIGTHYFSCSTGGHCEMGQLQQVTVVKEGAKSESDNPKCVGEDQNEWAMMNFRLNCTGVLDEKEAACQDDVSNLPRNSTSGYLFKDFCPCACERKMSKSKGMGGGMFSNIMDNLDMILQQISKEVCIPDYCDVEVVRASSPTQIFGKLIPTCFAKGLEGFPNEKCKTFLGQMAACSMPDTPGYERSVGANLSLANELMGLRVGETRQGQCSEPELLNEELGLYRTTCYSDKIHMKPGQVVNLFEDLYNPYPDYPVAVIEDIGGVVEGDDKRVVPLSEVYVHHIISPVVAGAGAEDVWTNMSFLGGNNVLFRTPAMNGVSFSNTHLINNLGVSDEDLLACVECRCPESTPEKPKGGINCCYDCKSTLAKSSEGKDYYYYSSVTYRNITDTDQLVDGLMLNVADDVEFDVPVSNGLDGGVSKIEKVINFERSKSRTKDGNAPEYSNWIKCEGHQHIGGLGMWIYDDETGELICEMLPKYGNGGKYEILKEKGFMVGMSSDYYSPAKPIKEGQRLRLVSLYDNTVEHTGVMALIFVYFERDIGVNDGHYNYDFFGLGRGRSSSDDKTKLNLKKCPAKKKTDVKLANDGEKDTLTVRNIHVVEKHHDSATLMWLPPKTEQCLTDIKYVIRYTKMTSNDSSDDIKWENITYSEDSYIEIPDLLPVTQYIVEISVVTMGNGLKKHPGVTVDFVTPFNLPAFNIGG